LTIHKAKGLEFPVVILPGLHQGARTPHQGPVVQHDWSSRCYGITVGPYCNLGSVLVGNKMAAREEAEQRRLLYVGMTRARDVLMLSGGFVRKPGRDTVLALLHEAVGSESIIGGSAAVDVGTARMTCTIVPAATAGRRRPCKAVSPVAVPSPPLIVDRYVDRSERRTELRSMPRKVTPSLMEHSRPLVRVPRTREQGGNDHARFIGICTHALLERWDFTRATPPSETDMELVCRSYIPTGTDCWDIVRDDLASIVDSFRSSEFYRRMRSAAILGREIPFVISWRDGQVMEGVIDLMYRLEGKLWIADYKTDRVEAEEAPSRALRYESQATAYRAAVARCFGDENASFEFIFLRPGVRVEL